MNDSQKTSQGKKDMSELINKELHGTVRAARCRRVTLHTYTAPDDGWQHKEAAL